MLPGLGTRCLHRERETRIALTAREMAEGGNWLIPEYRDQLRLKKPPLPYWTVAALYKLGAPVNSAFWARLPTALMAIGLVLATYFASTAMAGWRAGFFAGLITITTQPFLMQGRAAEADIGMILFIVSSIGCLFMAMRPGGRGHWWLGAGAAAGVAFMMKGVAGIGIPVGTIVALLILRPDRLRHGHWRWAFGGLLLSALIAAPWYYYIYKVTTGDGAASAAIAEQLQETFSTDGRHPQPFYYYLENWPGTMAPWGLLIPFGIWCLWKGRQQYGSATVLAWFIISFSLLSLITTKQRHYALILLPPTAVAVAIWLVQLQLRKGFPSFKTMTGICAALAAAAVIWLAWWQPANENHGVIPGFMAEAEALCADRTEIWSGGEIPWCTEFYFKVEVESLKSVSKAWRNVPPGGSLIAIERGKPLKGIDKIDGTLVLDQSRGDIRCRLYHKEALTSAP